MRHVLCTAFWVSTLLLCPAAWAAAKPEATGPPEVEAARRAVARAVAAVVKDLGSDEGHKRRAAHAALKQLSESVMSEVVVQADLRDAEQTTRVAKLFESLAASARQGSLMISLSPKERKLVDELAREKPKAFGRLFHARSAARAEAVTRLAASETGGAEHVLCWAFRNGGWRVRLAAAKAAGDLEGTTGKINDALLARLDRQGGKNAGMLAMFAGLMGGGDIQGKFLSRQMASSERSAVLTSLVALKDKRILAFLLRKLLGRSDGFMVFGGMFGGGDDTVSMIVRLNDKRTIPTLMDHLDDQGGGNATINGITGKPCDRAMAVIVRQTKQSLSSYRLDRGGAGLPIPIAKGMVGFAKDSDRKAARKKLRAWWAKHKKQYAGVEKVSLDDAPDEPAEEDGF